ncbi:2OG-Fe(II) oxygenase [Arthrobacter sp. A2-55]|uniref:2OG-Fe(II) oxygenase n=1 Tax=Arthrobacter sp. A2-55 TaxID=2897337 RepID=UPI0021CD929F|nr:2OG-Fe(II) oxygenase [Arthrobacter sp. A2-55]MCU6482129.1 2OG-Fe(II) oxygenase [Arthrobacter sp. A2-55]
MPKTARERLAQILSDVEADGADSAMLRLPGSVLALEVDGVGPVQVPIRAAQAKQLMAAGRPAGYGRGAQTLNDTSVRDTWEIAPDRVSLGGPSWQACLDAALEQFGEELGLPEGTWLTAGLHSMLVYGKGQFFLPHQDSEKHAEMVATLVVMLPSVHTGGELVVDDSGSEQVYLGSRDDLVLVAFYADRRHEVRPVRSGYRVSLTFNLLLNRPDGTPETGGRAAGAASCIKEHFETRAVSPYGGADLGVPLRLAFLLDHEYTEGGLAAGLLKGADAHRVAVLQDAARQAGCESMLALAEIKETWDVLPDEYAGPGSWYGADGSYFDGEEAPDDDFEGGFDPDADDSEGGAHQLNSLIEGEISLGWWIGTDGSGAETIQLPLGDYEVCMVTPTESITPYETEFEGYMGNYGNTLDRWYRRAAMVMWPREKAFAARAEAGSAWAMQTLLDRIDAGELEGARADAASLKPFWTNLAVDVFAPALQVAAALEDAAMAHMVAAPFRLQLLTADHAPLLAALAKAYGDQWTLELVGHWHSPNRSARLDLSSWIVESLLPLCQKQHQCGAGPVSDGLAELAWESVRSGLEAAIGHKHPGRRREYLGDLGEPLARTLEAASGELGAAIAEFLQPLGGAAVELLVPVLRALRLPPTPAVLAIANNCRERLSLLAGQPARTADDWSIAWTGCGCGLCDRLAGFLSAPTEHTHEWPLATPGRQHVHQQIDASGLPLRHATRRKGRPYTLVLEKTDELFRHEDEMLRKAQADFAWLMETFG